MNVGDDIAQLSYKELQALALRYRVPGNIKKKVLVKVLQAARSGNEAEFSRLLQELRKNRKRKTKKPKDPKLGITSTPLHSPEYIMADEDYYFQQQQQQPQQQPPYQWIGAEEEIVSKDDDNKIPHYEEFKQFLLKRIQREFQTCNPNQNQIQDMSIMDLRTAAISPNVQPIPLDVPSYPKASLINDADPLAIATVERPSYQVLKEPEGSSQGSFLLKRMLQAPVGANLGEIASSLLWASNLLDNSDTLTAESESNENEDQLETATNANEYYNLLKNAKNEFLLNEANLRNVDTLMPQTAGEDHYRYPGDVDNRQNYQSWTVNNMMELSESDNLQSSKVFHTIYYNNATDPTVAANNVADNSNLPYQYQINNGETVYNGSQSFFNFDVNYPAGTDGMVAGDSPGDIYHLQNMGKNGEEMGTGYFRNIESLIQNNNTQQQQQQQQQSVYANDQQAYPHGVHSTPDVTYQHFYPRFTAQEMDNALQHERLENQQIDATIAAAIESGVNHVIDATSMQGPANGTVEPFWPRWTAQVNKSLENILNYHAAGKQVDYGKLNQTSCVYCYVAPIVSHRSSLANNTCSQIRRYTAEQRQHSFAPYWMLYNDTSQGMRMTNMPVGDATGQMLAHATTIPIPGGNGDHLMMSKEINVNDLETNPMTNDVWMSPFEQASIAKDINVQVSDAFFCNVVAGRIDDVPAAKT